MKVWREIDPSSFEFWSGAADRMNDATEVQRAEVFERILEYFGDDGASETEINDLVWFDCDDIFFPDECEEDD